MTSHQVASIHVGRVTKEPVTRACATIAYLAGCGPALLSGN